MNKIQPDKYGVCKFCEEEDQDKDTALFLHHGEYTCGSCINDNEGYEEYIDLAYGR